MERIINLANEIELLLISEKERHEAVGNITVSLQFDRFLYHYRTIIDKTIGMVESAAEYEELYNSLLAIKYRISNAIKLTIN